MVFYILLYNQEGRDIVYHRIVRKKGIVFIMFRRHYTLIPFFFNKGLPSAFYRLISSLEKNDCHVIRRILRFSWLDGRV